MAVVGRVFVVDQSALSNPELFTNEVDARYFLGDGVFYLESGVYLEKRNRPVFADQELARSGAYIPGFAKDAF
jgi:hypothetical protein